MINIFDKKYKLSRERILAINNLLDKNNIIRSKDFSMIKNYWPKKKLSFIDYKFDFDLIKKNLGADNNNNKYKLDLYKDGFDFKLNLDQEKYFADSPKKIKSLCSRLIKKIKDPKANFVLDNIKINHELNKKNYIYRQKYNGVIILDNFICFVFKNNFLREIKYKYKKPNNFFGDSYEIRAPDLILYDFIKNDSALKNNARLINKFDLVYKIKEHKCDNKNNKYNFIFATPVYRVIYNNNLKINLDAY